METTYNFRLTVTFSDGDVIHEHFWHQRWANSAKKQWVEIQQDDAARGETYTITSMIVEAM
jgi:hypothetical protein